jgi:hypothetical protein
MSDTIDEAITQLRQSKATTKCSDLTQMLEHFGFEVRGAGNAGHKVYVHDGLPNFLSSNYDCGHGSNPTVKTCYIRNVIRVLREHKQDLIKYLGEEERQ